MKNMQNSSQSITEKTTQGDGVRDMLMHHVNSFLDNNLEAVMSDYTEESVLITQAATYSGLDAINTFFAGLVTHFPKQKSSFVFDKIVVDDTLAYIVWHAKTPSLDAPLGSDTFIIKEGKIYQQTFVGQLKFFK